MFFYHLGYRSAQKKLGAVSLSVPHENFAETALVRLCSQIVSIRQPCEGLRETVA